MTTKIYKDLSTKAKNLSLSSKTRRDEFYKKYISTSKEEISLVLKSHLYLEKVIDEILLLTIPEPKKIIKMNFLNKVEIIESINFFPDKITIEKIKAVNTIRNKFSHELDYSLKREDLDRLFKVDKKNKSSNLKIFLKEIVYLHAYLDGVIDVNTLLPFLMNVVRNKNLFKYDRKFNLNNIIKSYNKDGLIEVIKEMKI